MEKACIFNGLVFLQVTGANRWPGLIFCLRRREAPRFNLGVSVPPDLSGLSNSELLELVVRLLG